MSIENKVDPVYGNMTTVRVAPGRKLNVAISGMMLTYQGALPGTAVTTGDTVQVPTFEVQYLRRDGMVI